MKAPIFFLALLLQSFVCLLAQALPGEPQRRQLLQAASTSTARQQVQAALDLQPGAFLNEGRFEEGYLYLLSGRRVLVPGLRYHVGQRLVEVQDSMQTDSTSFWPLAALRGFDIGTTEGSPAAARHFRMRLVQEDRQPGHREAVQILTATEGGPLVLAYLPLVLPGTQTPAQVLLAGTGRDAGQPLRPLDQRPASVQHLLGSRAGQVRSFASTNNLHADVPQEVAQMLNYYNQLVMAVD